MPSSPREQLFNGSWKRTRANGVFINRLPPHSLRFNEELLELEGDIDIVVCVCVCVLRWRGRRNRNEKKRENRRKEGGGEECHEVLFGRRRALVTSRDVSSYST